MPRTIRLDYDRIAALRQLQDVLLHEALAIKDQED